MQRLIVPVFGLIVVFFAIAIYFYPLMPDPMASHWDVAGQVDGYMGRFLGTFMMPVIALCFGLLFLVLPRIDPLRRNVEKFMNYYEGFVIALLLFLLYLYLLVLFWNMGAALDMVRLLVPAFGALFYYCGVLVEKAKRNWFIGIRTPWTMSSDRVWDKTHKLGGRLFKFAGEVCLLGVIFPIYAIWLVIVPALLAAGYSVYYSYAEYNRMKHPRRR